MLSIVLYLVILLFSVSTACTPCPLESGYFWWSNPSLLALYFVSQRAYHSVGAGLVWCGLGCNQSLGRVLHSQGVA